MSRERERERERRIKGKSWKDIMNTKTFNKLLEKGHIELIQPAQAIVVEQWKMSKITLVHKKGLKNDVSNYRPVANLCSASKIFEKLILQRIQDIEDEKKIDFTSEDQHGFKRGKSTTTAGLAIQSALARALDVGDYAIFFQTDSPALTMK